MSSRGISSARALAGTASLLLSFGCAGGRSTPGVPAVDGSVVLDSPSPDSAGDPSQAADGSADEPRLDATSPSDAIPVDAPSLGCVPSGWTSETMFFAGGGQARLAGRGNLAVDATGGLHLVMQVFGGGGGHSVLYARRPAGGTWTVPGSWVETGGQAFPFVAVEPTGRAHAISAEFSQGESLRYKKLGDDGRFQLDDISRNFVTGSALQPSALKLRGDQPHIAYISEVVGQQAGYMHRKNNAWAAIPLSPEISPRPVSLDIAPDGRVHLLYPRTSVVEHATVNEDDSLTTETVTERTTSWTRLAVDSSGGLHALYGLRGTAEVWYATRTAGKWVEEQVPQAANSLPTFLGVDAAKNVHALFDAGGPAYGRRVAGVWTVESLANVVTGPEPWVLGMVVEHTGLVHLVFSTTEATGPRTLVHAQRCPGPDAGLPAPAPPAGEGRWTEHVFAARPDQRSDPASAYDAVRNQIVMYGGFNDDDLGRVPGAHVPPATWLLPSGGGAWTRAPGADQPGIRAKNGMAFDAKRGRVVMMGPGPADQSVWEWDGQIWTARPVTASGPTFSVPAGTAFPVRLMFDSARSLMVVLASGAMWDWDGGTGTFTKRADWPAALTTFDGVVFDSTTGRVVIFAADKVWEWDALQDTFTDRTVARPGLGQPSGRAVSIGAGRIVLFDAGVMWEWTPATGLWQRRSSIGSGPTRRWAPGMTYDPVRGSILLFGGLSDEVFNVPIYRDPTRPIPNLDFDTTFEWFPPPP